MKYTTSLPEIKKVIMTNAHREQPEDAENEKLPPLSVYIQD